MTLVSAEMLSWLVVLVAGYWALPRDVQLHWASLVTAAFLFIYAPLSLAALTAVTAVCYFLGRRHVVAALAVCVLMLLAYRGLSSGNPMQAVSFRDVGDQPVRVFILLGFSYYILRAIHYLLERFKGRLEEHSLPTTRAAEVCPPLTEAATRSRSSHMPVTRSSFSRRVSRCPEAG